MKEEIILIIALYLFWCSFLNAMLLCVHSGKPILKIRKKDNWKNTFGDIRIFLMFAFVYPLTYGIPLILKDSLNYLVGGKK